ncbi:DUF4270 domain-containing protein [Flavobacterium sp. LHD-80]|uniref:DUF4270 domain-containing protein n=1 Tax=Flavobacterium sp. LHD-80 TaxID=3071411 RepID=UPI0027DFAFB8|nr:DUF4270 domain-containing protein [Flavobacterium sp. LHD-80]MDQ6471252.1 DUF4270 domain-containing protein [Flavobacterium sp. LHD-80]
MYNTSFIKKILIAATVVFLYSCDRDFNAIGDELIGDNHFDLTPEKYDVLAYNQEITPIQSNGLATNALGIYDNPVLGTTTGNYATQVALSEYAPTIGEGAVIDSVYISVPYFSHVTATDATTGKRTYELDSIFGPANGKLDLSIHESGVQMRSSFFDNGTQLPQLYYTDENTTFDTYKIGAKLNDSNDEKQNTKFFFNNAEITDKTVDTNGKATLTKVAPQMRLMLNKQFFMDKILKAPAEKLANATVFQDWFRGLYFKVERSGTEPANLALIDFAREGKITIKYKAKTAITTDPDTTMEDKSIIINLTGATASLQQDAKSTAYANAIADANINRTEGDESLYIKGGQGSVAVIELNGFAAKLAEIRTKNWLVNEANLVFNIDSDKMAVKGAGNVQADEPKRVYLYDLTNNVPLIDYSDGTSGSLANDPKATKYVFGGIINVDATTKRGKSYKIRITNHIRNLIKDATAVNVKLGLVVTEDIGVITSNKLKLKNSVISEAPRGSVMGPLGTILYGGKSSVADDKRLRLEIYYTKPN